MPSRLAIAMNTHQNIELLEAIAALSQRYPNWRLGQLVANIAGSADQEVWDIEDGQLLKAARRHLEQATGDAAALTSGH